MVDFIKSEPNGVSEITYCHDCRFHFFSLLSETLTEFAFLWLNTSNQNNTQQMKYDFLAFALVMLSNQLEPDTLNKNCNT